LNIPTLLKLLLNLQVPLQLNKKNRALDLKRGQIIVLEAAEVEAEVAND